MKFAANRGTVLRTGEIMTLHPSEGHAKNPTGFLSPIQRHQPFRPCRNSFEFLGILRDSRK